MAGEEIDIKVLEAALPTSVNGKKALQMYRTNKKNCPAQGERKLQHTQPPFDRVPAGTNTFKGTRQKILSVHL